MPVKHNKWQCQILQSLINENRHISIGVIGDLSGIIIGSVRMVVTREMKQRSINTCTLLLECYECCRNTFLEKVITGDEF